MGIRIIAFGPITDIFGTGELQLDNMRNTAEVINYLSRKYRGLESQKFAIAVKNKIININQELDDGDTVVLLPPFSGG